MQVIKTFEYDNAATVSCGVRVLLLSSEAEGGQTSRCLAGMGGRVEMADDLFQALSEVIDDPSGYGLFVVDFDSAKVGGLQAARRALTILRAPLSAVALKVGFEHALRDRLKYCAA